VIKFARSDIDDFIFRAARFNLLSEDDVELVVEDVPVEDVFDMTEEKDLMDWLLLWDFVCLRVQSVVMSVGMGKGQSGG
jgi:hypothetical protein